jgi:multiple sugar transport system permease protein
MTQQTAATPATTAAAGGTMRSSKLQEAITGYGFVAPALFVLVVFMIIPLIVSFYFSLTDWNGITPLDQGRITEDNPDGAYEIVGLENYTRILFEPGIRQASFYTALKNTAYYTLGIVPVQTVLALVLAVIVNQRWLKGKGFFRTAFYFPSITSSVVISLIFMWMFTSSGLVNTAIKAIFPQYTPVTWLDDPNGLIHLFLNTIGINPSREAIRMCDPATLQFWGCEIASIRLWDWFSGPSVTMATIMILNIWTTIGTMMIIYLAALQGIPSQVYEAAYVDGANAWQLFRRITVPLLSPTTFFVVTVGLIGSLQVFDQVYVMTAGGPNNTTLTVAYLVYRSAFKDSRMGLAAATAIVLFIIIFLFTMAQRRIIRERN